MRTSRLREDRWLFWVSLTGFVFWLLLAVIAHAEENDVAIALRVARECQLSPFQTDVLLCTRAIENGKPGREYGVLHPQAIGRDQVTQARWTAWTVRKRLREPAQLSAFARRWAPQGAANDPRGLNQHWVGNMEACLAQLAGGQTDE